MFNQTTENLSNLIDRLLLATLFYPPEYRKFPLIQAPRAIWMQWAYPAHYYRWS